MSSKETIDELRMCGLRLFQPRDGYRFSLDPLLLCDFAARDGGVASAIDLGTGCGVIPLVLAARYGAETAVGVECQPEMAEFARRNVQENGFSGRIAIIEDDILNMRRALPVSSFGIVLANPPYRRHGTGKISPKAGRDIARHETTAGLADFMNAAKYLVEPGGRICFIYHPSRLEELLVAASSIKLSLSRIRMVHGTLGAGARMFLAELTKGRKCELRVEPPLIVYGEDGDYTEEAEGILGVG